MQKLKEKNPLLVKLLTVVLLILLCYSLSSLPFYLLCLKQDRDIPPNTEVLVSACKRPIAIVVPGGEVLFVREGRSGKMYLLDLRTGEKKKIPNDPLLVDHGIFLSSELVWLEGSSSRPESVSYRSDYILDLTDGQRYELLDLNWLPLKDGKFDSKHYGYFQSAKQVFIHHSRNVLIALSPNFRLYPERNVIFSQYSLQSGTRPEKGKLLEQLMNDLGLDYEIVDFSLHYADVPSPTSKYVARYDGIYFSGTNTPAVTNAFLGWYFDDSGVVIKDGGHCQIPLPGANCLYYILGPILKLHLPAP
jgi:hypothetical protein